MRATPPAARSPGSIDVLDRFWGLVGLVVVVALEVFVFGPRGMTEWMIGGGVVGARCVVGWLADSCGLTRAATRRRSGGVAQPRWSSMKCVFTSPATNSGCSSTMRWNGITVFTPSTRNWSSAQRERARHSSRSRPHTMSLPSRLS